MNFNIQQDKMNLNGDFKKWYQNPVFNFLKVLLVLFIIQVGFGTYGVVLKATAQNENFDPLVLSLFRDGGSFPLLYGSAILLEGYHKPQLKHIPLFFILGLTGMFGNQVLYIFGLYLTSPTIASIFQPMIPVWTALFAFMTKMEPFDWRDIRHWVKLWGIFSSGGGAVIMVLGEAGGAGGSALGYILLLGNTASMAIYVLLQKKFLYVKGENGESKSLYPPITATAYAYGMGTVLMGLACIPYAILDPKVVTNLTYKVVYPLAYAIFISSSLCYALINYAASLTSATIVTAFWPLQVPVTAIESYIAFGDTPGWEKYVGALFIIFGLIAISVAKYSQENEETSKRY